MPSFTVDPDKLDEMASQLRSIQTRISQGPQAVMASGRRPMDFSALVGSVGHRMLEGAIEDFYRGWSDGLSQIHDELDQAIKRLQEAAQDYRTSDQNVSKAIPGTKSAGGG